MISSADALKFSMWLAATHPQAFQSVLNHVRGQAPAASRLGAVSGTYIPRRPSTLRPYRRGRFGALGDDDLETVTVQSPGVDDIGTTFDSSVFSDPTLQDINFSADDLNGAALNLSTAASAVDNSGGFWSSLGSGLSSVGSGLVSAIGSVAGAITNPQVLQAAGSIAGAVIKNNSTAQSSQLQQAVLQAQLQRTATGVGAAPVKYMTNPTTGQTQPYYYNAATGQYQLTQPSALLGSMGSLSPYLPYILIGGGVILVVALIRNNS